MFVPIILGSDKTTVSVGTGNNEYYPLYLSIGNVSNKAHRSSKLNTVQLVAFLSIPKSTYTSMNMLHILLVLFWSTWQLSGGTRNRMTFADLGNRYFIRPYLISSAHWRIRWAHQRQSDQSFGVRMVTSVELFSDSELTLLTTLSRHVFVGCALGGVASKYCQRKVP